MSAKAPPGIQVGRGACGSPSAARPVLPLLKQGPSAGTASAPGCPTPLTGLWASQRGNLFLGCPGGPREPFSGLGPPCEVSVVWRGLLSCLTARPSTRALSESSWETKNRGISLGRACVCRSVSLATPGSGPLPSPLKLGRQGRGAAPMPTHPPAWAPASRIIPSTPAPPALGWPWGHDMGRDQAERGRAAVRVPMGSSLRAWPAETV